MNLKITILSVLFVLMNSYGCDSDEFIYGSECIKDNDIKSIIKEVNSFNENIKPNQYYVVNTMEDLTKYVSLIENNDIDLKDKTVTLGHQILNSSIKKVTSYLEDNCNNDFNQVITIVSNEDNKRTDFKYIYQLDRKIDSLTVTFTIIRE